MNKVYDKATLATGGVSVANFSNSVTFSGNLSIPCEKTR